MQLDFRRASHVLGLMGCLIISSCTGQMPQNSPLRLQAISNVALGKGVGATSSYNASFAPEKAVDGNSNSFWASAAGETNSSWQVDLVQGYALTKIEIVARQDGDYGWSRNNFEIRASNNGNLSSGYTVLGSQGATPYPNLGTWTLNISNTSTFRYVGVFKTAAEGNAFAEVRVFADTSPPPPPSSNLAAGKTASASSSFSASFDASKAVDNSIGTLWSSAATQALHNWQVDLGQAYSITGIDVVHRQDTDQAETRRNYEVRASNNANMSGYVVLGSQGSSSLPHQATKSIAVNSSIAYRYVSVTKTTNEYFTLAEVRVLTSGGVQNPTVITPQEPERTRSLNLPFPPKEDNQTYFFENALELLDQPGEWYLNTSSNELFYMPRAGETMNSVAVITPKLEVIFNIEGTLASPVHHLQFQRLIFENSTWMRPSSEGFAGWQAGAFNVGPNDLAEFQPGGVRVAAANNIVFERNTFHNMGANGLNFYGGVQNSNIIGNTFNDLSGQGISIDADGVQNPADTRAIIQGIGIKNNRVTRIGLDYTGSVGIQVGYIKNSEILHNQVWDIPYTGISVGWGWTSNVTQLGGINTSYNNIFNVMKLHDDGGGIYTWSNQQPTSIVSENYIHDINRSPVAGGYTVAGIYIDQQGNNIAIRNNVLQPLGANVNPFFRQPCCGGTTNIEDTNNGGNSQTTINNAGIEPGY